MARGRRTKRTGDRAVARRFREIHSRDMASISVILHQSGTLTSSAGGTFDSSIDVGSLTYYADYSDFTDHYDEYRIIGGRVKFYSSLGPGHTSACSLWAMAFDNDGTSMTPGGTNAVIKYSTSKTANIGRDAKYFYTWERPAALRLWYDCSSPTNAGCVAYYATSLAGSTLYAKFEVETIVEFRGRR